MQPTGEEVRAQLERLLASEALAGSARLRRFLSFIVERTLEGEGQQLKEYAVGIEVFDRGDDYDPRIDSIVRVEAGRLRARLDEYYRQAGSHDAVVIRIPRGGYTPVFERRPSEPTVGATPNGRRVRWVALATAAAAAVGVVTLVQWPRAQSGDAQLVRPADPDPTPKAVPARTNGPDVSPPVQPVRRSERAVSRKAALAPPRDQDPAANLEPVSGIRVAVLPFAHYSTDPAVGLLAARVTDGVMSELVRTGRVEVVSRTSTLQFATGPRSLRDVARALNANLVVEGSVHVDAERVRLQVRMVDPDLDRKFSLHEFEGTERDLEALHRRVAAAVNTLTRPPTAPMRQ